MDTQSESEDSDIKDAKSTPKHRAKRVTPRDYNSKSTRVFHTIMVFLFAGMFIGTAYAGYSAYQSSYVELKLIGAKNFDLSEESAVYSEPGFYARHCVFSRCHDLTDEVVIENPDIEKIKQHVVGDYEISYTLTYLGETITDAREIIIRDTVKPELTLSGPEIIGLYVGESYDEPGFFAQDDHDGDITNTVTVSGEVDTGTVGAYAINYSVSDNAGNTSTASRKVFVYNYSAFTNDPIASFEELIDYIHNSGWDVAFGYKDLEDGYVFTHDPDRVFYGASLVKTLDAMYVYEKMVPDSNLKYQLTNVITYSNNGAHMALASRLGVANLRAYGESIGMKYHLKNSTIYETNYFCDTTVNDQLIEWTHLWELVNNLGNGWELKNYFTAGYAWSDLNFYGSENPLFKAGHYGTFRHETGIFPGTHPYLVSIMTTENGRWNRSYILKDLSERVYLINSARHL